MYKRVSPQDECLATRYIRVEGQNVFEIKTNESDVVDIIFDNSSIGEQLGENHVIGSLQLVKTDCINSFFEVHKYRDIKEEESVYPNRKIVFPNGEMIFNVYPNNSIIKTNEDTNEAFVLAGNFDVLLFYCKKYFREMVSRFYESQHCVAIHCCGVNIDGMANIFVADANCGKSTTAINAVGCGARLLNDDVIICRKQGDNVMVKGLPIIPSIRQEGVQFITGIDVVSQNKYFSEYVQSYYMRDMSLDSSWHILNKVIFLNKGQIQETELREKLRRQYGLPVEDWNIQGSIKELCEKLSLDRGR